ncbi:MAG: restriction endonuclease subunit S, partial [Alphaproteobacteria bacterium]|nr:restriction endonuclease subunit S [Alphaproteobacteria bacterium]
MRLADACTIHTGYTARGRLEPTATGGVLAIQLRDISPDGLVDPERLTRVQLDGLPDRYFVRAGDVVFRSRGERNTASALGECLKEPALAVLPLMVLRPNLDVVTPEFLAWSINQPPAQRH